MRDAVRLACLFGALLGLWLAPPGNARAAAQVDPDAALAGFDDFATDALERFKVPGMAVAVVKDGRAILIRGYGQRDARAKDPVTGDTLFGIGSCTKAFTATTLSILADQGRLDLDAPVRDTLPWFRLKDEYATAHATTRDLLLHRVGLARYDAVLPILADQPREEVVRRLRHLEPNKDFRAAFEYCNLTYVAAGVVAETVSGQTWEALVRERILDPLGMKRAVFSLAEMKKDPDHAQPHRLDNNRVVHAPGMELGPFGPAGSLCASAAEMANWLLMNLGKGDFEGRRVVSEEAVARMHTPQIIADGDHRNSEIPFGAYGLAWGVSAYRGRLMLQHSGETDGFHASVALLPDDGLGVAVLSNRNKNPLPEVVVFNLFDRLLGLPEVDWSDRVEKSQAEAEKAETARRKGKPAPSGTAPPSHDLADYVGVYVHPAFGELLVGRRDETLTVTLAGETVPLRHMGFDNFETGDGEFFDPWPVAFAMNPRGDIEQVAMPLEPTAKDIVFVRSAPEGDHNRAAEGAPGQ